ncbi:SCAR family protein, putative isoform 3 [Hibiscus syriacus]|uniref:Protein SCAR n=1 Tax=Hibiscus syriacus TaxID=106335 RepID=A0A6A3C1K6_HIBSY|nr:protein SCAR1-like [Hibiscus syriacus]KAE8723005.1 SCAR family protein, putative isoform 3 [Hibiscus syriacus]
MPLVRAQVKNEYSLGKPELYKEVNREDPKAVLDGVTVSGLVGILRQLGDLAEFAAEVFHGLQEQVMSAASRSHKLTVRVQRIEAALPSLEKAVLSQTSHIHFAYTAGSQWHPQMHIEKKHFIYNDLPRFVMDSYEVCRDPPSLHLLDKFDAGGSGSCLKRYSDPTYFRRASGISIEEDAEKYPRNRKTRKSKKRRSSHRNGKLSRGASLFDHSSRMQFTSPIDFGQISSPQTAYTVDMTLTSEVGERSNSFDSRTVSGYHESVSELGSSMLPEEQELKERSSRLLHEIDTLGSDFPVEQTLVMNDNLSHGSSQEQIAPSPSYVMWDEKAEILESKAGNWDRGEVPETNFDLDVQETGAVSLGDGDQMDITSTHMDALRSSSIENQSYEIESEPDYYMDALNTIESEYENDIGCYTKREVEQWSENEVKCQMKWEVEQNDGANHVNTENREDGMPAVTDDNVVHHLSMVESSASSNIISSNGISTSLPDPYPSQNPPIEQMLQLSGKSSDPDNLPSTDLYTSDEIHNIHPVQMLPKVTDDNADHHPLIIESSASSNIISGIGISTSLPELSPSEKFSTEQMLQFSGKSSDPDNLPSTDLCTSDEIHNISLVEPVISDPSSSSGYSVSDSASDSIINSASDSQNSHTEFSGVHSVGFWTNGGLLGLQPSKPPDFAVSTTSQGSAAKTSEAFGPPNQTVMALRNGPEGNSIKAVENEESIQKLPGSCCEKTSLPIADLDASLAKPVTSHCNSSLDSFNDVGSSINTSFSHGNNQPVTLNVKATSVESDEENDDNSSRMFGLGHKSLVNGFQRKVSIGQNGESEPTTSKTGAFEQRNGHQTTSNQKISWTAFNEQIGNGSPVNSLTSSPPLEHMKISFNAIDGFETSKLILQFPDGNHCKESIRDIFPAFQLVPLPAFPGHDVASDSDDDTFCRSSPYLSDDCLSPCTESNSEQWESGETPESKDPELYDALRRLSSMEPVSSLLQTVEGANDSAHVNRGNKSIVHGNGLEPSLLVFPDLPSFDSTNPVLQDETKSNSNQKNHLELQNTMELTSLSAAPHPQWRVSEPCFGVTEERQHSLSESLRHELDLKLLGSIISQNSKPPSVKQQQIHDNGIAVEPDKKVDQEKLYRQKDLFMQVNLEKLNKQKDANQLISGSDVDEKEEFLHQIRTKSFNLRPTVTSKPSVTSAPMTNVSVTAILQKANAIRQAVGSDDGEDDDTWSDN